ncbi:uromodulin isoform X2 [Austrofundulus limnaeus]|uniref:Uromodulin isoform X2 n=1 Tax=Austrofundulus limnaeus TaxID=52670 RepID=A0A2I4C9U7_AUSLI|nr:PREDICTED: uromodulin-like isoform X2 [Austrofundulus limnaeus]
MAPVRVVLSWFLFCITSAVHLEPEEELNETVICTNDHMDVLIPSVFFLNKVPPVYVWDLHLNDPECRGIEVDDNYVFSIKTNLSDCGTVVVTDDTHIMFINTIQNNISDVITRNYINITFVCRYPISYMVQQSHGENLIRVEVSCPVLVNEETLSVLKNGEGPEAMFRIQMFKFVGSSYTNVFLHCNVQICHSSQSLCQPNCSAEDGLMRIRRDVPLTHTVSYGPIRRLLTDKDKPNLNPSGVPPVETFVLGGLLMALLLVTVVFGRLWLRSRRLYSAREAQLTLANIHYISEVAW